MFNDGWRRADGSDDNRPNGTTISAQTHFAQTLGGESKIVRHVKCVRNGETIVAFVWTDYEELCIAVVLSISYRSDPG